MSDKTITVKQEVEAILRVQAATYLNAAQVLTGEPRDFYTEVAHDLTALVVDYVNPPKDEEPEAEPVVKVGDKVRLTGSSWDGHGDPNVGDIVTVTGFDDDGDLTFRDADNIEWYTRVPEMGVTGSSEDFQEKYGAELYAGPVYVKPKVGDTVRVLDGSISVNGKPGTIFVVTEVRETKHNPHDYGVSPKTLPLWIVKSKDNDVWGQFIEILDPTIKVGDTVRITEKYREAIAKTDQVGKTFTVTSVVKSPWTSLDGQEMNFYVKGDPQGFGMWDIFIEKVYA